MQRTGKGAKSIFLRALGRGQQDGRLRKRQMCGAKGSTNTRTKTKCGLPRRHRLAKAGKATPWLRVFFITFVQITNICTEEKKKIKRLHTTIVSKTDNLVAPLKRENRRNTHMYSGDASCTLAPVRVTGRPLHPRDVWIQKERGKSGELGAVAASLYSRHFLRHATIRPTCFLCARQRVGESYG